MKGTAFIAGAIGLAASVVSATPSPAKVEARATSSAAASSGSALPTVTVKGNGKRLQNRIEDGSC